MMSDKSNNPVFQELIRDKKVRIHLGSLLNHHPETYGHSLRVGKLGIKLGDMNECNEFEVRILGYSGLLHDLGKMAIDSDVLSKRSKLSEKEREDIEEHSRIGFLVLQEPEYALIKKIIVGHHEYQNGSYPRKASRFDLKESSPIEKRIEDLTQIIAVADMYDALSNKRSYREAFQEEKLEKILREQFTGNKKFLNQVLKI